MSQQQHDHPKRIVVGVLVSGERLFLRHEPDSWKSDPLAGFKAVLQSNRMLLFTNAGGGDVWIRPSSINAWWRHT